MEAFTATMEYSSLLRPFSAGSVAARAALALPMLHPRRRAVSPLPQLHRRRNWPIVAVRARATDANASGSPSQQQKKSSKEEAKQQASTAGVGEEVEEVEEELPWIEEKALDLVEFTGTVTQAVPGPRIGESRFPWLLAVPLAYLGITFVFSVVKAVKKFTSPRAQRKRLVNKNATLLTSIDELFVKAKDLVNHSALEELTRKTGFTMDEILRKYIRYTLNEKPFGPDLVVNLIHLRKASQLEDSQVAEVLNEVSRRIVKEKGPVVMDISGFTEKGFKRKLAVQTLFGKILYLSELPEFCSRDSSLIVKEIFGVTDEDADSLRQHTLSATDDVESIKKMAGNNEATEPTDYYSSSTPDEQRESKNGI